MSQSRGEGTRNHAFVNDDVDHHNEKQNGIALNTFTDIPRSEKSFSIELDSKPPLANGFLEKCKHFWDAHQREIGIAKVSLINLFVGVYFAWATYHFIEYGENNQMDCGNQTLKNETNSGNQTTTNNGMKCNSHWCNGYGMLLVLLTIVYAFLIYFKVVKPLYNKLLAERYRPLGKVISNIFQKRYVKLTLIALVFLLVAIFIGFETFDTPDRLRSLLGIFILFGIGYAFSSDRKSIKWRPVLCGAFFQFLLGVFCLRMDIGRTIFQCLGDKVSVFFDYAMDGASFVYGKDLVGKGVFAFAVLPVIFFFSFIVSVLYFYGAMQWIIKQLGSLLQSLMGTTLCESVIVSGNIFLGMTESPLLIKPYIKFLTASEIHLIMASGFATVSGTVLAAYILFGAEPMHLITSSVMAAPATLAFAKLIYPETETSQINSKTIEVEQPTDSKTVLDAAANGAFAALPLIAGITANLVAFVSMVAFLNGIIGWLAMLVGHEYVSFEWIFGKLFTPLAYIIGIRWDDCEKVGAVIATKTIVNEFVAFERLGKLAEHNLISPRSSAVATFAICGFANFCSLGMMIGNLGTMCPEKRSTITSVSIRALVAGSIVCFINASIANLLMPYGA